MDKIDRHNDILHCNSIQYLIEKKRHVAHHQCKTSVKQSTFQYSDILYNVTVLSPRRRHIIRPGFKDSDTMRCYAKLAISPSSKLSFF